MGIARHVIPRKSDPLQPAADVVRDLARVPKAVDHRALGDDVLHGHARIERGVGILKDHLNLARIHAEVIAGECLGHTLAAIEDLAFGLVVETCDGASECRLSAA